MIRGQTYIVVFARLASKDWHGALGLEVQFSIRLRLRKAAELQFCSVSTREPTRGSEAPPPAHGSSGSHAITLTHHLDMFSCGQK